MNLLVVSSFLFALWLPFQAHALGVALEWGPYTQNPDAPTVGFNVYRSEGCTSQAVKLTPQPLPTTQLQYEDQQIAVGPKYCYYVTALSAVGRESRPSNTVQFQVQEPQSPQVRGRVIP